ncbi:MAG: hypothetical protein PVH29_00855 [Candidatus Zixiibacteriota bacterium]|jgi:hypothetical protein
MARSGFRRWWVVLLPFLFLPLVVAQIWGPSIFGSASFARFVEGGWVVTIAAALGVGIAIFVTVLFMRPMLSLFGGGPRARRILEHGRPARATVRSIGESSLGGTTTVNDQPYLGLTLEVDDGTRPPYVVQLDTIIPRAIVPQFQPGSVIPVKIDPRDPREVRIDWN